MVGERLVLVGVLALTVILSGCARGESPPWAIGDGGPPRQRSEETRRIETTLARCAVGQRPAYFVPGPPGSPLALVGCARLGVSGKRVEFSANVADIDGVRHACVNPAYSGRRQPGMYIPAICALQPPLSRFAVRDAAQPRQGVRGYAYVIWGTAGASTKVVARFTGGSARAAVFRVGPELARTFGESPFSLFVTELPLSAACAAVTVTGDEQGATERIQPRTRLCERAPSSGPARPQ
jgi:hypothetical protein